MGKSGGKRKTYELHNFADASTCGYIQCSYLRVKDENEEVNVTLVMGKSHVAPSKIITVPRLELTTAVVSAKVGAMLQEELNYPNLKQDFWTDSNRVQTIRSNSDPKEWQHIDTSNNPADHASRGLRVEELIKSNWFSGPSFLWDINISLTEEEIPAIQIGDPEVKTTVLMTSAEDSFSILDSISRYSSWVKAVGVITYLKRVLKKNKSRTVTTTVAEREEAETFILKEVQRTASADEITRLTSKGGSGKCKKNSPLLKLNPFLDDRGLLRVGGRVEKSSLPFEIKHPVILPRSSHVTNLMIEHYHQKVNHQGKGMTMNEIRSNRLWIANLSAAVSSHIYRCVQWRRQRRPTEGQKMADLPMERVEITPPFTYCNMDCFGPFTVREGSNIYLHEFTSNSY